MKTNYKELAEELRKRAGLSRAYADRLDHAAEQLEGIQDIGDPAILSAPWISLTPAKRRGRKFMNEKERQEVSERMKRYWANRRRKS